MLIKALRLIKEGIADKKELADRLGIHESTLEDGVSLLVRKGYLRSAEPSECPQQRCAGCLVEHSCGLKTSRVKAYIITERGRRLLETG